MGEPVQDLIKIAAREPIGVDVSDYSDEFVEGFLAGQESVLLELSRAPEKYGVALVGPVHALLAGSWWFACGVSTTWPTAQGTTDPEAVTCAGCRRSPTGPAGVPGVIAGAAAAYDATHSEGSPVPDAPPFGAACSVCLAPATREVTRAIPPRYIPTCGVADEETTYYCLVHAPEESDTLGVSPWSPAAHSPSDSGGEAGQCPLAIAVMVSDEATFETYATTTGYVRLVMRPHGVAQGDDQEVGWDLTPAEVDGLGTLLAETRHAIDKADEIPAWLASHSQEGDRG